MMNTRCVRYTGVCALGWSVVLLLTLWPASPQTQDLTDILVRANEYHTGGDLDRAAQAFQRVLQIDPHHVYAQGQLGLIYFKKGDFLAARETFRAVLRTDPRDAFAHLWLGVVYLKLEELEKAFETFQQLAGMDPQNANAHYFLGALYSFRRDSEHALRELEISRSLNSNDPETHYRLARTYHQLGKLAVAEEEYLRTLERNPRHISAMNDLGWLYYIDRRMDPAISMWKEVIRKSPQDKEARDSLAKAYNGRAWAYVQAGNSSQAVQMWRMALQYDPGNKAAKYFLKQHGGE